MASTPPPSLSSPQAFRLPPLPAFHRPPPPAAGAAGRSAHPFLSGRDSLSASFSLGPDSLLDHLQLVPGTPAAGAGSREPAPAASAAAAAAAAAAGDRSLAHAADEYEQGANNSSLLPCSPRLTTAAARSIQRAAGGGRRRRPSSLSFGDLSGQGADELSALQLGRSPANGFQLNGRTPAASAAGAGTGGQQLGTPPVRSRLRFGRAALDSSSDFHPHAAGAAVDDSSFVRPRSGLGVDLGFAPSSPVIGDGSYADEAAEDEEDEREDGEADDGMVERMRMWRHDAMLQHLYETAAFWGEKVLSWTGDKNDAFWLAQIHFLTAHYSRALRILLSPLRPGRPPRAFAPLSPGAGGPNGWGKGKSRAMAAAADDDDDGDESGSDGEGEWGGPARAGEGAWAHGLSGGQTDWATGAGEPGARRMVDISLACRYLAGQCQVRMGAFQDALETLGPTNPFAATSHSSAQLPSDGGFKLEASMCLLRGTVHLRLGATECAKQAFVEALALDVRCYDAFQALVGGEMMGVDEEWDFIQGLCYKEQTDDCAEFIRMVYTVRLKKFKHLREISRARKTLTREFALGDNADVLFGRADALYAQYRWAECYAVTSRILAAYPSHAPTLPLHLACMHHLPRLRSSLFLLAHTLAEQAPDEASSWYAVGLWYYTGERWGEARRFFGKASLMDPRFGAAWIAFAHSFAMEKEHDQAITAYSTAARLFQGSHLPMLHIGMEHLQLQNIDIAAGHFASALATCQTDPLLFNELGVVAFSRGDFALAVDEFTRALEAAKEMQGSAVTWAPTRLNLGHALRKTHWYDEALEAYSEALRLDPVCDSAFAGRGMVYQLQGRWNDAIECYHEALSLNPQSAHVTPLLNLALSASIDLLGPLHSIPALPPSLLVDPMQASWASQQQQQQHSHAADESTADYDGCGADGSRAGRGGSYAGAMQQSHDTTHGAATEDGSTMEIEDSM